MIRFPEEEPRAKLSYLFILDDRLIGYLGIADPIKPSARIAVESLHHENIAVVMMTGDEKGNSGFGRRPTRHRSDIR